MNKPRYGHLYEPVDPDGTTAIIVGVVDKDGDTWVTYRLRGASQVLRSTLADFWRDFRHGGTERQFFLVLERTNTYSAVYTDLSDRLKPMWIPREALEDGTGKVPKRLEITLRWGPEV